MLFDKLNTFVNKFQNKILIEKIKNLIKTTKNLNESNNDIDIILNYLKLDKF